MSRVLCRLSYWPLVGSAGIEPVPLPIKSRLLHLGATTHGSTAEIRTLATALRGQQASTTSRCLGGCIRSRPGPEALKGPHASHYTIQPGETGRNRTFDLGDVNAALSQLSYALWYRMKESDLRLLDVNQSRYHYADLICRWLEVRVLPTVPRRKPVLGSPTQRESSRVRTPPCARAGLAHAAESTCLTCRRSRVRFLHPVPGCMV